MSPYHTQLYLNPQAQPPPTYGPTQQALLDEETFAAAKTEITSWPEYAPTPLIDLPQRAAASGMGQLHCKHEGFRFGLGSFKPTGPTYAMLLVLKGEIAKAAGKETIATQDLVDGTYRDLTSRITVGAVTSGNHGRALAWGAQLFGCRAVIYMSDGVSPGRERAIAAYGAEIIRVPGPYDRAVRQANKDAAEQGYFLVSDQPHPDYPQVPSAILQGYALVADEIADQLPKPPTHVFAPGGGGILSGAVCGQLWRRYGDQRPKLIVVEPTNSCCLYASARAGRAVAVDTGTSLMDGLVVEQASVEPWQILGAGADAFLTIPDQAASDAMTQAANPLAGDPPLVIGDTGSAAWAGFLATSKDPDLRQRLDLNSDSRIVLVTTEGATDPEVYQAVIGQSPEEVLTASP
ncbi:MAG: diaminopropionate ammonia-lyase [Candidatus Latescibacteria bacterium]|nr:diaminopropionate ammonia-lyase [Candidatus Latescibacterota bacterium]